MNPALIEALNRASSLELFHLSMVLDRLMRDPARIIEIRRHLHLGQTVRFLNWQLLASGEAMSRGQIIAMKETELSVQDERTRTVWKLPYAAIEIPAAGQTPEPPVQEAPRPGRADFRVGDRVSFDDRHLQTHIGTIVRINQRTASLDCDGQSWRVPFAMLRHVVDL